MKRFGFLLSAIVIAMAAVSADEGQPQMVIVKGEDLSGKVFKRLGLPDREYCWQQCLKEDRCTGVRWGVLAGDTAGQCQLVSGELTVREPRELKTEDGQTIVVVAARKQSTP